LFGELQVRLDQLLVELLNCRVHGVPPSVAAVAAASRKALTCSP
jgi:hypothetical protein